MGNERFFYAQVNKDSFRLLGLHFLLVFGYGNISISKSFVPHLRFFRELEREMLPFLWMVDPVDDRVYLFVSLPGLLRSLFLVDQFNLHLLEFFPADYEFLRGLGVRVLGQGKPDRIVYWQTSRYVHYLIRSRPVYGASG